jgi:hypothetical protein
MTIVNNEYAKHKIINPPAHKSDKFLLFLKGRIETLMVCLSGRIN